MMTAAKQQNAKRIAEPSDLARPVRLDGRETMVLADMMTSEKNENDVEAARSRRKKRYWKPCLKKIERT